MHANRTLNLGAIAWVASVQYYLAQILVSLTWAAPTGFSVAHNTISDLGNTACGVYGSRYVCSPEHLLMNISFVVLGATMITGAFVLQKCLAKGLLAKMGFICLAVAGGGTILVGLYPENSVSALHIAGAALSFVFGNLGMVLLGFGVRQLASWGRYFTIASGLLGLGALILFLAHHYAGLSIGGMERVVGYPQSIWMILCGSYLLLGHRRKPIPR